MSHRIDRTLEDKAWCWTLHEYDRDTPRPGKRRLALLRSWRLEAARRLLSESRTPVKRIAQRCGFGSEETMRRSFLRLLASLRKTTVPGSRSEFSDTASIPRRASVI
jgi:hypothetical protein